MANNRGDYPSSPLTKNETGFSDDADLYSLLNLPNDASVNEIEKQFRKLQLSIHPDKYISSQRQQEPNQQISGSGSTELADREEVYHSVQKAYTYLTNPLTKIIYDEFGVTGLAIYEKNKSSFSDLQEELRGLKVP